MFGQRSDGITVFRQRSDGITVFRQRSDGITVFRQRSDGITVFRQRSDGITVQTAFGIVLRCLDSIRGCITVFGQHSGSITVFVQHSGSITVFGQHSGGIIRCSDSTSHIDVKYDALRKSFICCSSKFYFAVGISQIVQNIVLF